ncbi:TPA: phosphoglycerate kinase [Patescibacteria group bacterium]|nr:MAG: Phosphoglycerate kinase [Parcubacteria group bacterium GW2011_GWF2_40_10]KKR47453.1 MAG: Phosphoglycerate kinase [Parcubacteria group bacterium GW2011_GWA2_40_143]KKR59874.1 MAG: Phosphoglycerate kinase [Parcubacteria group bacterium GW2011_GWC2_40_31]KKR76114.1 MAG: Phosphoglycerate kinase [Parcubacteria group bacterium GW2011_GWE2_40_8]HBB56597.1 phosphoglycerate kinase [Patescibacteria group bacterium]
MKLPSIKNLETRGKRVLLRVDFNALFDSGAMEDVYRIKRTMPIVEFLRESGAKVILLSHLSEGKKGTLKTVADYLNDKFDLKIKFVGGNNLTAAKKASVEMNDGEIIMLENIRLFDGEKDNSESFAKELASLADLYVNEAFSASHRRHASIVGLPKFLPSFIGPLFEEEIENLIGAFNPNHPFLLILGGVKAKSKLGVLDRFLDIANNIFIGGALANIFLKAKGEDIGNSVFDKDVLVEKYLNNEKIILPIDMKRKDDKILDAGEKTVEILTELIKKEKFILWNGPLGNIEEDGFDAGTMAVAKAIVASEAKSVIGGGDTVAVVNKLGILDKFDFVSTGGGAMLEFLAHGTLPGIEAIMVY